MALKPKISGNNSLTVTLQLLLVLKNYRTEGELRSLQKRRKIPAGDRVFSESGLHLSHGERHIGCTTCAKEISLEPRSVVIVRVCGQR